MSPRHHCLKGTLGELNVGFVIVDNNCVSVQHLLRLKAVNTKQYLLLVSAILERDTMEISLLLLVLCNST